MGMTTITDQDMRDQVTEALGGDTGDYDVNYIVEKIQQEWGTANINAVPEQLFWDIVADGDRS